MQRQHHPKNPVNWNFAVRPSQNHLAIPRRIRARLLILHQHLQEYPRLQKSDEMIHVPADREKSTKNAMENNLSLLGTYRHYKGKEYEVIGIAQQSETLEEMVVYRALYGEGQLWVRPLRMFLETVEVDGEFVPRFERDG